jgi:hypothetical protein
MSYTIGDTVWVETSLYSASRAKIVGIHTDGYYVNFIDKTISQDTDHSFPVLTRNIKPIDYIGSEK